MWWSVTRSLRERCCACRPCRKVRDGGREGGKKRWLLTHYSPSSSLFLYVQTTGEPPLVVCKGRTQAKVIAEALGLKRGAVFRLDREKYRRLERVGPFDRAWLSLVNADRAEEKLAVELIVHERPSRSFEPGLSKSLHTRDWMGDVYLEDQNFLGLNQAMILKLCKGLVQHRKEPCITMSGTCLSLPPSLPSSLPPLTIVSSSSSPSK